MDLWLLAALLAVDLCLIGIHGVLGLRRAADPSAPWPDMLNIAREASLGELFGYAKWLAVVLSLRAAWQRHGDPLYAAAAGVFLLALADDSLRLHENSAHVLMAFDLHLRHGPWIFPFGELAVWALLGLIALALLVRAYPGSGPEARAKLLPQAVLFGGVVFCAIGIDLLHGASEELSMTSGILGILEDGGEMAFLSAMLAHAWPSFGRPDPSPQGDEIRNS
ncbi:MAG: hypothetical protein ACLFQL_03000 [Paracoccaceae bacterium]